MAKLKFVQVPVGGRGRKGSSPRLPDDVVPGEMVYANFAGNKADWWFITDVTRQWANNRWEMMGEVARYDAAPGKDQAAKRRNLLKLRGWV